MSSQILNKTGKIVYLRVHDRGTGYGAPSDFLDAEVIVRLQNDGSEAYGLQLRNDDNLPAAQAMFTLLDGAFNDNEPVSIDYHGESGRHHHRIFRVWRTV